MNPISGDVECGGSLSVIHFTCSWELMGLIRCLSSKYHHPKYPIIFSCPIDYFSDNYARKVEIIFKRLFRLLIWWFEIELISFEVIEILIRPNQNFCRHKNTAIFEGEFCVFGLGSIDTDCIDHKTNSHEIQSGSPRQTSAKLVERRQQQYNQHEPHWFLQQRSSRRRVSSRIGRG